MQNGADEPLAWLHDEFRQLAMVTYTVVHGGADEGGCCYQERQGSLAGWPQGTDASSEGKALTKRRKASRHIPGREQPGASFSAQHQPSGLSE